MLRGLVEISLRQRYVVVVAGILLLTIVTVKLHWLAGASFNGWSAGAGQSLEALVLRHGPMVGSVPRASGPCS